MADDGLGPIDVTGRWIGFYRYLTPEAGTFPITAQLRHEGNRISGEMYDQITDRSQFLEEFVENHRLDLPTEAQRRIEEVIRQFNDESLLVETHLPETSDIEGFLVNGIVSFTKSYRGAQETRFIRSGRVVGSSLRERHKVYYSGHVDRERGCIAGEWLIRRGSLLGRFLPPLSRGRFELYRKHSA